ncbi:cytoskeletal adhesion-domain-containing protein [Baffinella frigidus]|nr:cytoskeletal adhesion-domain-containing protein [Cryptophyta sp. CCMP2293]
MLLPGGAVFFEFKHFKKDKNRISTRCWCFLEREDLAPGAHVLELYKKPADLKRKNIHLHTVKELCGPDRSSHRVSDI